MTKNFPFGQQLTKVQQQDRTNKKAFVLGVYASAVHARWVDKTGRQKVAALAVASEPSIFWTGEDAEQIIARIEIPGALGRLTVPSVKGLNGPSGRALDNLYLAPLGLSRQTTWLCDLLPESRVNEQQRQAIDTHYTPGIKDYNLPPATIPNFDKAELNSAIRRQQILEEIETSKAETLILLGDLPIYWFLRFHADKKFSKLSQFGETPDTYGRGQELTLNGRIYNVVPLCHPRQADRLGSSSSKWGMLHDSWLTSLKSRHGYPGAF